MEKMDSYTRLHSTLTSDQSIFPRSVASHGDVLAMSNPSKKKDTWKGKCEAFKQEIYKLEHEILALRKNVFWVETLKRRRKFMDSHPPSMLGLQNFNLL